MTFAEFCKEQIDSNRLRSHNVICYSDILPEKERKQMGGTLRENILEQISSLAPELKVTDDTYFERIQVLSDMSSYSPADQSYIFGKVIHGAWVVVDVDCDCIYIVARSSGSRFREAVSVTSGLMKDAFRKMKLDYSWWPCYAL